MVPFLPKLSQDSRRPLNVKMLFTVIAVAFVVIAGISVVTTHAASDTSTSDSAKQVSAGRISGGGCTGGDLKTCVSADRKKGRIVSEVTVRKSTSAPALVPSCPFSVTIKLFDKDGLRDSAQVGKGCGNFSGPTAPIEPGNQYTAQVAACFSADPADCAAVPSPTLKVS
jgi:hypothetical protein